MRSAILSLILVLLCTVTQAEETRFEVPIGDSPSLGPPDAPVTIIEFIDFQ